MVVTVLSRVLKRASMNPSSFRCHQTILHSSPAINSLNPYQASIPTLQQQNLTFTRGGHSLRVILINDLPDKKGLTGEVHTVKAGYARNYLIPQKIALYATPKNFLRVGITDPDLQEKEAKSASTEDDEDIKAALFLQHYLRNKSLTIWRKVDPNAAPSSTGNHAIYPGIVNHQNIRDKLSKQLKIDLEDHEQVQIRTQTISHSLMDSEKGSMQRYLDEMPAFGKDDECQVELRALGEYLVKIHLSGGQAIGLKLLVKKSE